MDRGRRFWNTAAVMVLAAAVALLAGDAAAAKKGGGRPGGEAAGNNLSFPVVWSDGVTKALPGAYGVVNLNGVMWYWWGTDVDGNPESCPADPDNTDYCDDGALGTWGAMPCNDRTDPDCMAVFQQQDSFNTWQAESADWSATPVSVTWIDWGDNLESVDWYTRSKVRTEVVLIQDLPAPMVQYGMRHLSGWGISELWGLATIGLNWDQNPPVYFTGPEVLAGTQATVYSGCARLTIQKLLTVREDPLLDLTWDTTCGCWVGAQVNEPVFNKAVWDSGDGPGYYSAEINVKGKVIYGYTWDVNRLHDATVVPPYTAPTAAGDYRITFALDGTNCPAVLNTYFDSGTQIQVPLEEVAVLEEGEEPGGGAIAYIDVGNNLTYMDVRILPKGGKKGGN